MICDAVAKCASPVIASTVASLVVFLPLAFTSDLSYAVLGDLAKTVVFSHGFSAFVALILVPTVRLQLMSRGKADRRRAITPRSRARSRWLENELTPARSSASSASRKFQFAELRRRSRRRSSRWRSRPAAAPARDDRHARHRLDRGQHQYPGNTLVKQMESQATRSRRSCFRSSARAFHYTFASARGNNHGKIMARLKDKCEMRTFWTASKRSLPNTATITLLGRAVESGGASDPESAAAQDRGSRCGSRQTQSHRAVALDRARRGNAVSRGSRPNPTSTLPGDRRSQSATEQWLALKAKRRHVPALGPRRHRARRDDRPARRPDPDQGSQHRHHASLSGRDHRSPEELGAIPVGIGSKLVPLKALADVRVEEAPPSIYREDEREVSLVTGPQGRRGRRRSTSPER